MKNVYDSFANERSYCNAVWFVDAHDYFSHLYDNILRAKESIFIAGWWVSPELYLKRPVRKEELYTNRLLDILKQKVFIFNLRLKKELIFTFSSTKNLKWRYHSIVNTPRRSSIIYILT